MAKEDKKFEMPAWAREGPITLKNYDYRAAFHNLILKALERSGEHPTLKLDLFDLRFQAWFEYFHRKLGGFPHSFKMLCTKALGEMTLPERWPQTWDPPFEPSKHYGISIHRISLSLRKDDLGKIDCAQVFVPVYAPQYRDMVEVAKTAETHEYYYDHDRIGKDGVEEKDRGGIWVSRMWLSEKTHLGGAFSKGGYLQRGESGNWLARKTNASIALDRNWKSPPIPGA